MKLRINIMRKGHLKGLGALGLIIFLVCSSCSTNNSDSSTSPNDAGVAPTTSVTDQPPSETSMPPIELPLPVSTIFGLSGIDATLYDAAVEWYSPQGGTSHLLIPSLALIGEYKNDVGDTCYICLFKHCDYYNLAYGLSDISSPQYSLRTDGRGIPTRFTISTTADGNYTCTEIFEMVDGADANLSIDDICGPFSDLAESLKRNEDVEIIRKITPDDPVELLQSYINFFFS